MTSVRAMDSGDPPLQIWRSVIPTGSHEVFIPVVKKQLLLILV